MRAAVWLILLLAFVGLANSSYIAKSDRAGIPLICTLEASQGCSQVAESPYSHVLGIPVAQFGLFFYGLLFILCALELTLARIQTRRVIQALSALGLIASAYFVFIQISIINAFCIYCVASAIFTLLIFGIAYFIEPFAKTSAVLITPPPRPRLNLPPRV